MDPIYFNKATVVARLPEILQWQQKLAPGALSLMATAITSGRPILVLESASRSDHTGALGLVMPGHDEGWLLMHTWVVTPFDSPRKAEILITPEDLVTALSGQAIKKDQLAFSPEVKALLAGWRAK
jgi:hypothetical protein